MSETDLKAFQISGKLNVAGHELDSDDVKVRSNAYFILLLHLTGRMTSFQILVDAEMVVGKKGGEHSPKVNNKAIVYRSPQLIFQQKMTLFF